MENIATPPLPLYGYLQKKGEKGLVRSYKKRWFEQNGAKIFYFAEKGEKTALGFIDCLEITSVRRAEVPTPAQTPRSPARRDASVPFEIITPKRIYEFIAPTEKDSLYWIDGINRFLLYQEALLDTKGMMEAHDQEVSSLQDKLEDVKKRHTLESIQWGEQSRELEKEMTVLQERLKAQEAELQTKSAQLEQKASEELERMRELKKATKELDAERQRREESESDRRKSEEAARLESARLEERLREKAAEHEREVQELRDRLAKKDADMLGYVKSQGSGSSPEEGQDRLREMLEAEIEERKREMERSRAQHEQRLAELAESKDGELRRKVDELERAHNASLERVREEAKRGAYEQAEEWERKQKEFEARVEELRKRVEEKNERLRELESQAKQELRQSQRVGVDVEGRARELERELRDRNAQLKDREQELSELKAKLARATEQKKAIKTEVKGKLNEMEKVLLQKSQELHAMKDNYQQDKKEASELSRLSEELQQKVRLVEEKEEHIRQLQKLNEEREADLQTKMAAAEAKLSEHEREVEALRKEKEAKGEKKRAKKMRQEMEQELSRAKDKAESKNDMLRALSQKMVEVETDLKEQIRAKEETIEHLNVRLADTMEQKEALTDRFEDLLRSSQHSGRDEVERKRKQQDEVNELRLQLRLKNEEIAMLSEMGDRGKGHFDEGESIMNDKMEELRQELFYSLAVGIKLHLSMQGVQCTQSTTSLYEDATRDMIPTSAWNSWIYNRLNHTFSGRERNF